MRFISTGIKHLEPVSDGGVPTNKYLKRTGCFEKKRKKSQKNIGREGSWKKVVEVTPVANTRGEKPASKREERTVKECPDQSKPKERGARR